MSEGFKAGGAWHRATEAIKSRFIKEKSPEVVDSMPEEDLVNFTTRLQRMAGGNDVIGVYHYHDLGTIVKVPKGTKSEEICRMFIRQAKENNDISMKLEKDVVDIDGLTATFDTLDFNDVGKVLEWCVSLVESRSPNETAKIFKKKILATFAEHGYTPGMNRGHQYKPMNAEDRDSAGGCIIGDMLAGIDTDEPFVRALFFSHIRREYDEWREKFETKPAPEVAPAERLRRLG